MSELNQISSEKDIGKFLNVPVGIGESSPALDERRSKDNARKDILILLPPHICRKRSLCNLYKSDLNAITRLTFCCEQTVSQDDLPAQAGQAWLPEWQSESENVQPSQPKLLRRSRQRKLHAGEFDSVCGNNKKFSPLPLPWLCRVSSSLTSHNPDIASSRKKFCLFWFSSHVLRLRCTSGRGRIFRSAV